MATLTLGRSGTFTYDRVARGLHWSMALLITSAFVLGLVVDAFPKSWEHGIVETHKVIGLAIILLLVTRLAWRLAHRPAPSEGSRAVAAAAGLGHLALYGLMLIVPVIGLVYALKRGQGLDLGIVQIPPLMTAAPRAETRPIREWHEWAAYALIGLAFVHAAAAIWHHAIKRDGTLRRMWPAR